MHENKNLFINSFVIYYILVIKKCNQIGNVCLHIIDVTFILFKSKSCD